MAPVFDKKSTGIHQYQVRILQSSTNGIHRELQLQEDQLEATNIDVACNHETKLQPRD